MPSPQTQSPSVPAAPGRRARQPDDTPRGRSARGAGANGEHAADRSGGMRYRLFGHTGLRVSELGLGAMVFGDQRGCWGASRAECARIVEQFAQAGGNYIDTASNYAGGASESVVGELIASERERWVLGTKYTVTARPDDPNAGGNHRKSLVRSLERSLSRLGTDYIDVLWVHAPDRFTPIEEVLRALDDHVRAGKVLYTGISDFPAWRVAHALALADARGLTRFAALQVPYSLIQRTVERELLPMAQALELTVTSWAPLGGGLLTGRYGTDLPRPSDTRLAGIGGRHEQTTARMRNLAIADAANAIARERGASTSQVAIAWILAQHHRAPIIPILGTRTTAQLSDNLAALELDLTPDELERLDQASRIELGFPHDFDVSTLVYGNTEELINDHRGENR
jgi:aryl-alcohol dehydrogenase-like predicted oxidoreductase